MTVRVSLVVPPFLSVVRPSLAASVLKASLEAVAHKTKIHYANMWFAEEIGAPLNEWISVWSDCRWLIGEWIFSPALYGVREDNCKDEYINDFLGELPSELIDDLCRARRIAHSFVSRAAKRILNESPNIVGFSTSFQQNCAALSIAREIKLMDPDVAICFGGANCEGPMGDGLIDAFPQIDFVFSGESDFTFPDFVTRVFGESGVRSKSSFQETIIAKKVIGPRITNLDSLPTPNFSDYFESLSSASYRSQVQPGLLFESSRGCWWGAKHHCKFCGLNGSNMVFRSKSPSRVLSEVQELALEWGVDRFEAVDNILDTKHIEGVFGELANNSVQYDFFYEVKSNMSHDQLRQAALGGLTWAQPGIESLDDDILKLMNKGVSGLQNIRFLRSCAEIGIRPVWNILFGIPGECPAAYSRMANLIPIINHLYPPDGCCNIRLDRFSPYFENSSEMGFSSVRPMRAYEYIYTGNISDVNNIAYYFEGIRNDQIDISYVEPLEKAVKSWRDLHWSNQSPPILAAIQLGDMFVIRDTRPSSRTSGIMLSKLESSALSAFRDPKTIHKVITKFENEGVSSNEIRVAIERIIKLQLLAVDADRAVSVVCEFGWRVHDRKKEWIFPGGAFFTKKNFSATDEIK